MKICYDNLEKIRFTKAGTWTDLSTGRKKFTEVEQNPIESADEDLCITLCVECHKEVHRQKECNYHNMGCLV